MIDVKEFRLGNLVQHVENKEVYTVMSVEQQASLFSLTPDNPQSSIWAFNRLFNHILITSKWLERFGFEVDDYDDGYDFRWIFELPSKEEWVDGKRYYLRKSKKARSLELEPTLPYRFYFDGIFLLPCEYVHELQNAFYCLTGLELKLKEDESISTH